MEGAGGVGVGEGFKAGEEAEEAAPKVVVNEDAGGTKELEEVFEDNVVDSDGTVGATGGDGVAECCFPQLMVKGFVDVDDDGAVDSASALLTPNEMGVAALAVVGVAAPSAAPPKTGVVDLDAAKPKVGGAAGAIDDALVVLELPPPRRLEKLTPCVAGVPLLVLAAPPKTDPLIGVELKGCEAAEPKEGRPTSFTASGVDETPGSPLPAPSPPPPPLAPTATSSGFSLTPADKSIFSTAVTIDLIPERSKYEQINVTVTLLITDKCLLIDK